MGNNYHIKQLVSCTIQFDKDFHKMEGGIPALDNITELIIYINQTMDVSNKAKDELDDIDTKCLMYRDVCSKPDTPDSKCKDLFKDVAIDFIATCRTYGILDIQGKRKELKMKKLINWIWSKPNKQAEAETETIHIPYEKRNLMYEARMERERALFLKLQEENRRNPKIPKRVID